ncbi:rhamnogalacturonan lyase B N-terminal domain-containing protein [Solihabitans fulvus]|nr:rhamnogalacturonan lyase B N-terminal domain-containing protein [Solihabitans fulvus]
MAHNRRSFLAAGAAGVAGLTFGTLPAAAARPSDAGFGLTDNGASYTASTGAGLTFTIKKGNGDLISLNYQGVELQPRGTNGSHVESGLGNTARVTATQDGTYIVITESVTNWRGSGTLIHYFVAVNGLNNIYMATYVDSKGAGELRWIQYLNREVLANIHTPSDVRGGTPIESKDIDLVGGQTRSKYYSNRPAVELVPRGVTGNGIGVYMAYGNRESSSGGPFFRDIEQQGTGASVELYNYLWSGHNDTEAQRLDVLYGPYALMVADETTPDSPDMTFMGGLGLRGYVPESGRGYVSGTASGISCCLVGFANSQAQYWAVPNPDGTFTSPPMKPGAYAQTLFQGELEVARTRVTVAAGATSAQDIASAWNTPDAVFRIGDWDGTPGSFNNAGNVTRMHPSDTRMSDWGPTTFTVGDSDVSSFPAYQWKDVNSPTTIQFTLGPDQITDRTVRIGITAAYAGARPQIQLNDWTSPTPEPSTQPKSRSLTIGTYRGNNAQFSFQVPTSAFVAGTNTLVIDVISGSGSAGYLSAGFSYDCVDMY